MKVNLFVFALIMFFACKQPAQHTKGSQKNNYLSGPVAVVIKPSDRLINKMKKENSEDDFSTIIDDNSYYLSQSETYIDSVHMRKITHTSEGALYFKTTSGKIYTMKLDSIFFGLLLFNGKDKPIDADMTDMATDYKRYMSK